MSSGLLTGFGSDTASLSKVVMFTGHLVCSVVVGWQAYQNTLNFEFFLAYIAASYGANSTNKAISVFGKRNEAQEKAQGAKREIE